jgi:hypothetical protein
MHRNVILIHNNIFTVNVQVHAINSCTGARNDGQFLCINISELKYILISILCSRVDSEILIKITTIVKVHLVLGYISVISLLFL